MFKYQIYIIYDEIKIYTRSELEITKAKELWSRDSCQNERSQKHFFLYCFLLVLKQAISELDLGEAIGEMHLKHSFHGNGLWSDISPAEVYLVLHHTGKNPPRLLEKSKLLMNPRGLLCRCIPKRVYDSWLFFSISNFTCSGIKLRLGDSLESLEDTAKL